MESLLIPGLPDEVARCCLARLPRAALSAARYVCKLWRDEIDSPGFNRLRRALGAARTLIAVGHIERNSSGEALPKGLSYSITFYEPHSRTWSSPPPAPCGPLPLFCGITGAGREMVVIGGWDPETWAATDGVCIYDFYCYSWRCGAPMPGTRRSFFACAASPDGRTVYVAGGHDEDKKALRSALAYDVPGDAWSRLPDMSMERDECVGVFRRGAFHVIGGYPTHVQGMFVSSFEAYDPTTGLWTPPIEHALGVPGGSPRGIVADGDGRLLRCSEGHLEVLEREKQNPTWRKVAKIPLSADGKPMVAPFLVSRPGSGHKLMLIGSPYRGGSRQAGFTVEIGAGGEARWQREAALPVDLSGSGRVHAACSFEI